MRGSMFLADEEVLNRAIKIARLLDGVPASQVAPLLEEAKALALASTTVRSKGQRFKAILQEFHSSSV